MTRSRQINTSGVTDQRDTLGELRHFAISLEVLGTDPENYRALERPGFNDDA